MGTVIMPKLIEELSLQLEVELDTHLKDFESTLREAQNGRTLQEVFIYHQKLSEIYRKMQPAERIAIKYLNLTYPSGLLVTLSQIKG